MLKQNIEEALFISHNFIYLKLQFVENAFCAKIAQRVSFVFTCNLKGIALNLLIKQ